MVKKPIVLFVDDEQGVLEGFRLTQSRNYEVRLADSAQKGLEIVQSTPDLAVVVSDMQMPGMDGATFLGKVNEDRPEIMRLLLTGHSDIEVASRAVNEGRIYRFLTKPCRPEDLSTAIEAAVDMHRMIAAERVLLHKTLLGAVRAVVNVLGLANPMAMGRAVRVRERSRRAAERLNLQSRWSIEFAALLSQLATTSLPEDLLKRLDKGEPLGRDDQARVAAAIRSIADQIREIPRLDAISDTLEQLITLSQGNSIGLTGQTKSGIDARLLLAVIDLERYEAQGRSSSQALEDLRRAESIYGPDALSALAAAISDMTGIDECMCPIGALCDGMVLADDLRTKDGVLLLPRGFELTRSSRDHIINRFKQRLPERVKVHTHSGLAAHATR